jgi:hypothetical protein
MLVESSRSSIASNSSTSNSSGNNSFIIQEIPSTIIWSQTLESITLKINVVRICIQHCNIHMLILYIF